MVARGPFLGPFCVCVLVFLFDGVVALGGLGFLFCWFCRGCCGAWEVAEGGGVCFLLQCGFPASWFGLCLGQELEGFVWEVLDVVGVA